MQPKTVALQNIVPRVTGRPKAIPRAWIVTRMSCVELALINCPAQETVPPHRRVHRVPHTRIPRVVPITFYFALVTAAT